MDNSFDNNDSENNDIEKTIIEGPDSTDDSKKEEHPLQDGESINASGLDNPYQIRDLPDGEEQIELGSGVIKGVLGLGGMAKVYKIWNDDFEMHRAVKVILPGDNAQNYERFKTEIKITAKLQNPNIIQIYNIGEWKGLPYIEMEYIEGTTLTDYLKTHGKLTDDVCVSFAIQIANALNYAHNCEYMIYGKKYTGIIHRDLKPDNIMVSQNNKLKLMDFGIARPTETGLHTMTGHFIGSPQYMSPEQFDGGNVDNRSDIYSLGTIVYEMLTGEKAFDGDNLQQVLKLKAVNSYKSIKKFDFKVNPLLANCTEKCMQEKKEKRFQSADELLMNLGRTENTLSSSSLGSLKIGEKTAKILIKQFEEPITKSIQQVKKQFSNFSLTPKPKPKPGLGSESESESKPKRRPGLDPEPEDKAELKEKPIKKELPIKKIIIGIGAGVFLLILVFVILQFTKNSGKKEEVAVAPTKVVEKSVKPKPVKTVTPAVFIKGGTFMMGGKNKRDGDTPIKKVTVEDFIIGQYEVTNKEYLEFLNTIDISADGYKNDTEYIDIEDDDCAIGYKEEKFYFLGSRYAKDINCPVIEVTWYGANAYCRWKNGRLPTEAEWEYACRAGTKTKYYWGREMDSSYVWFGTNSDRKTHPVGKKKPNEFELYDMIGNVWEWCGDLDDINYYKPRPASDSTKVTTKRDYFLRGGSCFDLSNDCRVSKRLMYDPDRSDFLNGFRVVLFDKK